MQFASYLGGLRDEDNCGGFGNSWDWVSNILVDEFGNIIVGGSMHTRNSPIPHSATYGVSTCSFYHFLLKFHPEITSPSGREFHTIFTPEFPTPTGSAGSATMGDLAFNEDGDILFSGKGHHSIIPDWIPTIGENLPPNNYLVWTKGFILKFDGLSGEMKSGLWLSRGQFKLEEIYSTATGNYIFGQTNDKDGFEQIESLLPFSPPAWQGFMIKTNKLP